MYNLVHFCCYRAFADTMLDKLVSFYRMTLC